jgi:YcxB-like protein
MRCEYIFTYQDFLESVKAYRQISKKAAISYYLYVWILPIVSLTIGVICIRAYFHQDTELYGPLFWISCIGLGATFGFPARYRMGLRRAFQQRNALAMGKPMFFEFDDATVRFIVPEGTEVSYPWTSFTDYWENDRVAVLFVKEAAFHTIPKRAMGENGCI